MKPKMEKITFDKETLEKVNKILNSGYNSKGIHTRLRAVGIRSCLTCGSIATKQLIYQVGDKEQRAAKIENYCDRCFTRWIKKEKREF